MLEDLFTALTTALTGSFGVALAASFAWGIASILLSPCHLASIPLVVGYIVRQGPAGIRRAAGLATTFAVGILITIALIGVITAALGRMLGDVGVWGNVIVGAVFLAVGLYLLDLLKISWNPVPLRAVGANAWIGALVLGLLFGIGLGPCTFAYLAPVLGVVFSIASTDMASAMLLIAAFGAGHCSIIVAAGSLADVVQRYLDWTGKSAGAVRLRRATGVLVLLGEIYFFVTAF